MHRLSFIKKSALFGTGILATETVLANLNLNREKIINIAMIGCGDRGKGVLSVIASMPAKFNIVAYCDVLDFRLKKQKSMFRRLRGGLRIIITFWMINQSMQFLLRRL